MNDNKTNLPNKNIILNQNLNQNSEFICTEDFQKFLNEKKRIFCHNMGYYKIDNKITMKKLSDLTGINIEILEQYQIGTCDFDFRSICKIAFALGITVEDVFRE
jgi:hypothetical protein